MLNNEVCHVVTTSFHNEISRHHEPGMNNRYWLFTSKLCPFAHRTEIVRSYLELENTIGLTISSSVQTAKGWDLVNTYKDSQANPVSGTDRLPALYLLASPGYSGRASVPVLFDTETSTIINNESSEIIQQLHTVFNADEHRPSLYPVELSDNIDKIIAFLEEEFINPIYRAGFASNQSIYEENFNRVFKALDTLEQTLNHGEKYLAGKQLSLADVHAYPHLSRFDAVYHSLYKLNLKFIRDYPMLSAYMTRIAKVKGFSSTLDIDAMKQGYFLSWNQPTEAKFVPIGPVVDENTGVALASE